MKMKLLLFTSLRLYLVWLEMTLNPSVSMFFPHTNVYTWYQTKCLLDVIVSLSFIKLYQTPSGCTGASTFPKKS